MVKLYNKENKGNYAVLHETMHLMGFSNRYNEQTGEPHKGYGSDIMGRFGEITVSYSHYQNMLEFVNRQPSVNNNYMIRIYGDRVIDKWFEHGKGPGKLKR